ncbi:hypothetical protein J2W36_003053 [Variovorax ginsengisoli]|uniref:Uncharacterized protein n=1 Tax=Variovorax ginsengisoli TaxID=363844 RepID=A0ABT9SBP7_9BURK|nr:hypothetical protein [Variovorax ginsengisoli]
MDDEGREPLRALEGELDVKCQHVLQRAPLEALRLSPMRNTPAERRPVSPSVRPIEAPLKRAG